MTEGEYLLAKFEIQGTKLLKRDNIAYWAKALRP